MLLCPHSQNCNEDIFMLINQFVFCPHINKDLCVTIKNTKSNGMYVVPAKKFERMLEKGVFKLSKKCEDFFGREFDVENDYSEDVTDVLKGNELWTTVDGVWKRSFSDSFEVTYCPVVFDATRQNLVALNILYKGAYSNIVDLEIADLKERFPLTSKWIDECNQ